MKTDLSNLTIGQPVAIISNSGYVQGFYTVKSISPKGTKITVSQQRNDGEYVRTFNNNNIEQNGFSSRFRTDFIRTDVDQVRIEVQIKQAINEAVTLLKTINPSRDIAYYPSKTSLNQLVESIEQRLTEAKQLINNIPD